MIAVKVFTVLVWTERSVGLSATYFGANLEVCWQVQRLQESQRLSEFIEKMSEKG